jgi:hypothetical protein
MSTQTTKKSTNPFVYVIAAGIIAILAFGLRFLVDALESNNAAIDKETEVKNYLAPKKQEEVKAPATSATGTATGTTTSGAMPK